MNIYILLLLDILATASAHLLLKKGAVTMQEMHFSFNNFFPILFNVITNPFIVGGLILYGIGFSLWIIVLSKLQLNIAYPISVSLTISLIAITSVIFYKESLTLLQIGGIVIIILGIFVVLSLK